jgi:release factor glutamine methyltransferase
MLTILEIVRKTAGFFDRKGVEQARLNAELIVGHCLGLDRMQLYLQFERPLTEAELIPIREKVRRRGLREPLQYVLGTAQFHDLKLKVDARVLVPRPETEQMAERIREHLGTTPSRIVDLGTGSGALALCLALTYPEAEVLGVDLSPGALEVAQANAEAVSLGGRVRFLQSDWFASVPAGRRFDLIVANPPYLSQEEWTSAAPEVREHEPRMALVGSNGGGGDLERILEEARERLEPDGHLILETGIDQHARLMAKAESLGYTAIESLKDWSDRDRFLWMRGVG